VQKGLKANLEAIVAGPFARTTYTDAVEILKQSGKKFEYPVEWGVGLQTEHERYLTEEHFKRPVILTDYPKAFTAFYMRLNEDGKTVRNMDVLVPQVGEIIGGSQREERHDVLLERMKEVGLREEDYAFYVDLRKYGTAPHAGFGLGFERLVLLCTGMGNIRDVIPFPRTPGHCDF
jgi:asparaginyl-tRNA synthetase